MCRKYKPCLRGCANNPDFLELAQQRVQQDLTAICNNYSSWLSRYRSPACLLRQKSSRLRLKNECCAYFDNNFQRLKSQGTLARARLPYLASLHLDPTSIGRCEIPIQYTPLTDHLHFPISYTKPLTLSNSRTAPITQMQISIVLLSRNRFSTSFIKHKGEAVYPSPIITR